MSTKINEKIRWYSTKKLARNIILDLSCHEAVTHKSERLLMYDTLYWLCMQIVGKKIQRNWLIEL